MLAYENLGRRLNKEDFWGPAKRYGRTYKEIPAENMEHRREQQDTYPVSVGERSFDSGFGRAW